MRWKQFLGIEKQLPAVRFWPRILSYSTRFFEWASEREDRHLTEYALEATWRDFSEANWRMFLQCEIVHEYEPTPVVPGPAFWVDLHAKLAEWVVSNA